MITSAIDHTFDLVIVEPVSHRLPRDEHFIFIGIDKILDDADDDSSAPRQGVNTPTDSNETAGGIGLVLGTMMLIRIGLTGPAGVRVAGEKRGLLIAHTYNVTPEDCCVNQKVVKGMSSQSVRLLGGSLQPHTIRRP